MRRALAALLAAVLVVLPLTGCTVASKGTREGADRLRDALGTPDWATGVTVTTGRDGSFADTVQTTVDLAPVASDTDVVTFALGFPARVAKAGLGDSPGVQMLRFVQPEGSSLDVFGSATPDATALRAAVARWRGVAALALDSAQVEVGTGVLRHLVTAPDADAVATTYVAVRADPTLALPADAWTVLFVGGGVEVELGADTLPTATDLVLWDGLVSAAARLPPELPRTGLRLTLSDRAIVDLTVAVPDDTTEADVTPATYGDRLWPAVRGQLAALHTLDIPWTYTSQWAPVGTPTSTTIMVSLLDDQPPTDNGDVSTQWSQAAREYVDSL